MTYEEAIKIIEKHAIAVIRGTSKNTLGEALEIAIKALEKQIKRKVKKEFGIIPRCPVCDQILYNDFYCRHCGQALDWSEKE